MPTPEEILSGLALAANKYMGFSIAWHILVLIFTFLLLSGKKMNLKHISSGMGVLLLSVGFVAYLVSNPFNAVMFALAAVIFGIFNMKFKPLPVSFKWDIVSSIGFLMLIFGFVYPHFLVNVPLYKYFYASPLGLIPCPTLSAFIGLTLMLHGSLPKKWMFVAALLGLFYGIFGVLRLKVYLDVVLLAGAIFLLVYALGWKRSVKLVED
jgi:hypothetical protein